jgi:Mg2+-importing ATPase
LEAFWSERVETLIARLQSSPSGLTSVQARERLVQHGPNALRPPTRFARLRLLSRQFESPLVAILVFAAFVSIVVGDWIDAAIVFVILLGSALLGFVQEYRASLALEQLRSRVRVRATVLRDGEARSVPPEELVPGDVIALAAGSLVPADAVVLEARDLFAAEAALTGEAFPVEKRTGADAADATHAERANCVFMGTSIRSGTARPRRSSSAGSASTAICWRGSPPSSCCSSSRRSSCSSGPRSTRCCSRSRSPSRFLPSCCPRSSR